MPLSDSRGPEVQADIGVPARSRLASESAAGRRHGGQPVYDISDGAAPMVDLVRGIGTVRSRTFRSCVLSIRTEDVRTVQGRWVEFGEKNLPPKRLSNADTEEKKSSPRCTHEQLGSSSFLLCLC